MFQKLKKKILKISLSHPYSSHSSPTSTIYLRPTQPTADLPPIDPTHAGPSPTNPTA